VSEELKKLAAVTALNKMLAQGYFSVSTIDTIAKMLGVSPPKEPYDILHTIHCVHYGDMPESLKAALPGLIKACIDIEPDFRFTPNAIAARVEAVVEVTPEPKKAGLLRLLGR
jgi:hypothetical protein